MSELGFTVTFNTTVTINSTVTITPSQGISVPISAGPASIPSTNTTLASSSNPNPLVPFPVLPTQRLYVPNPHVPGPPYPAPHVPGSPPRGGIRFPVAINLITGVPAIAIPSPTIINSVGQITNSIGQITNGVGQITNSAGQIISGVGQVTNSVGLSTASCKGLGGFLLTVLFAMIGGAAFIL